MFVFRKSEIEYYAMLVKTGVHPYTGTNVDLGTACGKFFHVGALAITDPGGLLVWPKKSKYEMIILIPLISTFKVIRIS
jgi:hypothetical protein